LAHAKATPNTRRAAQELAEELELRARRPLDGLEPLAPRDGGGTVGELLQWWLQHYSAHQAAHASNEISIRVHLLETALSRLTLRALRPVDVKAFMDQKKQKGLSPRSVNHLRGFLSRALNAAIATGRWPGRNPVASVAALSVTGSRTGDFLRAEEVPRMLNKLNPRWRPLYATALYTAMRKGELLALQREDVDLSANAILVRRSWERDTTKGGHADAIPIPEDLLPWLKAALEASESALVFPGPGGAMFRRDVDLEGILRRALGRAGVVRFWRHVCRRRGCRHVEESQEQTLRCCPKCQMKLWPKPVVRPIRFHDLRHTTATLLLRPGVPLVVVQKVLRHRDPKLTEAVYGHLETDYLRAEVNRLKPEGMPQPEPPRRRVAVGRVTPRVTHASRKVEGAGVARRIPERLRPLLTVGETGFEPATPWSRRGTGRFHRFHQRPTHCFRSGPGGLTRCANTLWTLRDARPCPSRVPQSSPRAAGCSG
jgi:integrase